MIFPPGGGTQIASELGLTLILLGLADHVIKAKILNNKEDHNIQFQES